MTTLTTEQTTAMGEYLSGIHADALERIHDIDAARRAPPSGCTPAEAMVDELGSWTRTASGRAELQYLRDFQPELARELCEAWESGARRVYAGAPVLETHLAHARRYMPAASPPQPVPQRQTSGSTPAPSVPTYRRGLADMTPGECARWRRTHGESAYAAMVNAWKADGSPDAEDAAGLREGRIEAVSIATLARLRRTGPEGERRYQALRADWARRGEPRRER